MKNVVTGYVSSAEASIKNDVKKSENDIKSDVSSAKT